MKNYIFHAGDSLNVGPLFFTTIPILAFKCLSPFLLPVLEPESLTIINSFVVVVLLECLILDRKSSGTKQCKDIGDQANFS